MKRNLPNKVSQTGSAPSGNNGLPIKRILVPTDFSARSERALQYALAFARPLGAKLILLHVVDLAKYHDFDIYPIAVNVREVKKVMQARLGRWAAQQSNELSGVKAVVEIGSAHSQIAEAVRELHTDLIIMSSHGHTNWKDALLGTTTEKVVRHATGPVLVIREDKIKSAAQTK